MEFLPHFFIFFGGSCDRRRSSVVRACAPLRLVSVRRFDFPWGLRMIGGFRGPFLRFWPASSSGRPALGLLRRRVFPSSQQCERRRSELRNPAVSRSFS